jgi:hypothetical protein
MKRYVHTVQYVLLALHTKLRLHARVEKARAKLYDIRPPTVTAAAAKPPAKSRCPRPAEFCYSRRLM